MDWPTHPIFQNETTTSRTKLPMNHNPGPVICRMFFGRSADEFDRVFRDLRCQAVVGSESFLYQSPVGDHSFLDMGKAYFAVPTMTERRPRIIWRGEFQLILDRPTITRTSVRRHSGGKIQSTQSAETSFKVLIARRDHPPCRSRRQRPLASCRYQERVD